MSSRCSTSPRSGSRPRVRRPSARRRDRPLRRRRGALRQPVGPRLPSRVLPARRGREGARRPLDLRRDGDRDAAGRARHRESTRAPRPGQDHDRVRPPEPLLRRRPGRLREGEGGCDPGAVERAGRAAGDRLRGHAQEDRGDGGLARARARAPRPDLPRRDGARGARRRPARLHVGRDPGRRRDQRVRDGGRQGRRADGDPRGRPVLARGLLPGGRQRRPRRPPVALRPARREPRQGPARVLHQPGRRPRGQESPLAPVPRGLGLRRGRSVQAAGDPAALRRSRRGERRGPLLRRLRRPARGGRRGDGSGERGAAHSGVRRGERARGGDHRGRRERLAVGRAHARRRDPARRAQQGDRQVRLRRAAALRRLPRLALRRRPRARRRDARRRAASPRAAGSSRSSGSRELAGASGSRCSPRGPAPTSRRSSTRSTAAASSRSPASAPTRRTPGRSSAPAAAGIETAAFPAARFDDREARDGAIADWLESLGVELVVLAGYMQLLSAGFVARFANRIVNVHPALLPAFPGLDAVGQALDHGVRITGVTVHFVDEGVDSGPIILQRPVPVPEVVTAPRSRPRSTRPSTRSIRGDRADRHRAGPDQRREPAARRDRGIEAPSSGVAAAPDSNPPRGSRAEPARCG